MNEAAPNIRRDWYPPVTNEPKLVLLDAACRALRPHADALRRQGWAAGITAHVDDDKLKVSLDIDLSGLKVPVEATP